MFTTKTYYVIANKNGEFFSYDKMTGGYPYFGKYHESAEHFQTAEKQKSFCYIAITQPISSMIHLQNVL